MSIIENNIKPQGSNNTSLNPLRSAAKKTSSIIRGAGRKVNPLDKPVNKNDTTDTGVESVKLGYRTAKKTYQTGKKTVRGVRVLYKAPVKTARIAVGTVKFAGGVVIHTAAFFLNPIFWILAGVLFLVAVFLIPTVIILAGGAGGATTTVKAYGNAAGVNENIVTAYPEAEEFYRIASENKQNDFNSMIDSLYYSTDDLPHSDLVYMKCVADGAEYQTSIATNYRKQQLKNKFSNSLSKAEAIALVYVYLEKQKNDENNTTAQIYEVEFTQQSFDDLLNKMISWNHTTYGGQECPQRNCSVHKEEVPNPKYEDLFDKVNMSAEAYNDWCDIIPFLEKWNKIKDGYGQSQYWDNNVGWRIDNWKLVYDDFVPYYVNISNNGNDFAEKLGKLYEGYAEQLDNTPPTIIKTTVTCDHLHELHSIGLNILTKEAVMDSWGFDDNYRQWVELTYKGFQLNPEIQD